MSSGKRHHKKKKARQVPFPGELAEGKRLEIVLKCDTSGCAEAIVIGIASINLPGVEVGVISSGVGSINKSDIFMAETGSRLIVGFNVGLMGQVEHLAAEHGVEVRLYEVIYRLLEDVGAIAGSFIPRSSVEEILGTAKVIALFRSSRKGIILGCEVLTGKLSRGKQFRVVGAMGPMYFGKVESLHIENDSVSEAHKGQQVGLKIRDFSRARIGDLVEIFQDAAGERVTPWQPHGRVVYP